ncbi:MAG: hypothetical protein AAF598_02785 [Bacteroidota bacterium]
MSFLLVVRCLFFAVTYLLAVSGSSFDRCNRTYDGIDAAPQMVQNSRLMVDLVQGTAAPGTTGLTPRNDQEASGPAGRAANDAENCDAIRNVKN